MRPVVSFSMCCRCSVTVIDVVLTKVHRKQNGHGLSSSFVSSLDILNNSFTMILNHTVIVYGNYLNDANSWYEEDFHIGIRYQVNE